MSSASGVAARMAAVSTPLNSTVKSSSSPPRWRCTSASASFDTTTSLVDPVEQPSQQRRQQAVAGRAAGGVERADRRCDMERDGRERRTRCQRLVHVDHVEDLVAEHAEGPQGGGRVGRERRHRAVGGGRKAVAERGDERLRRRTVARRQHPHLVPTPPKLARQPEHLGLHTTGIDRLYGHTIPIRRLTASP